MSNILTDDEVLKLRLEHKKIRDKKLADRIKAVLMLHRGFTYTQVSQALLLDEVTLRRYVKQYQKRGMINTSITSKEKESNSFFYPHIHPT